MHRALPTPIAVAGLLTDPRAVHVPAWMYVQDSGPGLVSFVGARRVPDGAHSLRYGSDRTHQLTVGEVFWRPHWTLASDALQGHGLGGLATQSHGHPDDIARLLADGELLHDPYGRFPDPRN